MPDFTDTRYDGMLLADGFDEAIIGTAVVNHVEVFVYSEDATIEILMDKHHLSLDEAQEHFEFNIAGSYIGEYTPVWVSAIRET